MGPYPPISDYAYLSDCHSAALVSRAGSVDWCCMPRLDSDPVFGRLLDWERGGFCVVAPAGEHRCERRYLDHSLVLETRYEGKGGAVRVVDCMTMRQGGRTAPHRQLLRIVEGLEGELEMAVRVEPCFHYGTTRPWMRRHGDGLFSAIGGDAGLLVVTDLPVATDGRHALGCGATVAADERYRLSLQFAEPHTIYPEVPSRLTLEELDRRLEQTLDWWRRWCESAEEEALDDPQVMRSAVVVRGLVNAPTGAIAAAATTSLPEHLGGCRNWDYRFSWLRDSTFALGALAALGFHREAEGFRVFVERTTASSTAEIQPMYGVDGDHLLHEIEFDGLDGYCGSRPVRIGNDAYRQVQLDVYGDLLELAWRSAQRDHRPSDDHWAFLCEVVATVLERWREPDRGIWEVRSEDRHFVHSKAMCWAAVDRALKIAGRFGLQANAGRWEEARDEMREEIEAEGYDEERGTFRRAYGSDDVDAALLLLPRVDFVAYDDPRMVRTADRVRDELSTRDGLVRRYLAPDGLEGDEGCFLACSFWLAGCLALQGRRDEAQELFDRVAGLANDLGLFSEEYDEERGLMLGNFPQGLTHFSHISAAVALSRDEPARAQDGETGEG